MNVDILMTFINQDGLLQKIDIDWGSEFINYDLKIHICKLQHIPLHKTPKKA